MEQWIKQQQKVYYAAELLKLTYIEQIKSSIMYKYGEKYDYKKSKELMKRYKDIIDGIEKDIYFYETLGDLVNMN